MNCHSITPEGFSCNMRCAPRHPCFCDPTPNISLRPNPTKSSLTFSIPQSRTSITTKMEQVTLVLLSLLNKNPHRRVGLATAASLLECPVLWSAAASDGGFASGGDSTGAEWRGGAYTAPHLPPDVRGIIEHTIRDYLLVNPALDTASGAWWEAPQFDSPWWEYPPTVEPILFEG